MRRQRHDAARVFSSRFCSRVRLAQRLPSGQEVSAQVWGLDPAGPFGWAAANAVAAMAP